MRTVKRTVWQSHLGPILVIPRAGLTWSTKYAYAIQDANTGNTRTSDVWLQFAKAGQVHDLVTAMKSLGIPWVNTIATDRLGNALYADVSVIPDIPLPATKECALSPTGAGAMNATKIPILNGSYTACGWNKSSDSPVPGLLPIERLPVAIRTDWVHNSNDSYLFTHPDQKFSPTLSPLIGQPVIIRPRTYAGATEIPAMIARGPVTLESVQKELFAHRNIMAERVLPDLIKECPSRPSGSPLEEACAVLGKWDRTANFSARGAHLFREFWRIARNIPNVHRVSLDPQQIVSTPYGLKMSDPVIAEKVWEALGSAVAIVKRNGFALDAPLSEIQYRQTQQGIIPLSGGDEHEGVLSKLETRATPGLTPKGYLVDYGNSYIQTVRFNETGPVAEGMLTYGQSSNPLSPYAFDQLKLYSEKRWHPLPFHPADIEKQRIAPTQLLSW